MDKYDSRFLCKLGEKDRKTAKRVFDMLAKYYDRRTKEIIRELDKAEKSYFKKGKKWKEVAMGISIARTRIKNIS